jgi:transcriptional regulator with XRE-family HTH domain
VSSEYEQNRAQRFFDDERRLRGWSWETLGEKSGVAKSTVYDIINKPWKQPPAAEDVNAIAAALGVSRDLAHKLVTESAGYLAQSADLTVPEWLHSAYAMYGQDPTALARFQRVVRALVEDEFPVKPPVKRPAKKAVNGR